MSHIAHALQLNCLTDDSASKLRGGLGFYNSLLMGKLGRGILGPLIDRQYRSRTASLTSTLRRSPLWRYNAFGSLPLRTTPFVLQQPFGAHSDTQGLGRIGRRVIFDRVFDSHTYLPSWFVCMARTDGRESPIYLFEICAEILTARVVIELALTVTRSCVLCIDNHAPLAALVKGKTSAELGSVPVGVFWTVASRSPVRWWLEYARAPNLTMRTSLPGRVPP